MPICTVVNVWTRAYYTIPYRTEQIPLTLYRPNAHTHSQFHILFLFLSTKSHIKPSARKINSVFFNVDQNLIYSTFWIHFHIHDLGTKIRSKCILPLCSSFNKNNERRDFFFFFIKIPSNESLFIGMILNFYFMWRCSHLSAFSITIWGYFFAAFQKLLLLQKEKRKPKKVYMSILLSTETIHFHH